VVAGERGRARVNMKEVEGSNDEVCGKCERKEVEGRLKHL
jgi:hypothetical protein